MTENEMRLVKACQLDLLCELDRICRKNNINYFLCGGTLLGAVRHQGFIPWDDDIDVGMLRADYERFKKVCKTELNSDYSYIDWDDDNCPYPFAKLRIKGTQYVEEESAATSIDKGIFIDIFPFDEASAKQSKQKKQAHKLKLLFRALLVKSGFKYVGIKGLIVKCYCLFNSLSSLKKKAKKVMSYYTGGNSGYVVCLTGAYGYKKETQPSQWYEEFSEITFENRKFSVIKNHLKYLESIYGDYLQLPPEDERNSKHKILKVDFGNYHPKSDVK